MRWIDTQLLVYRAIEGHPGKSLVEDELSKREWGSSVLVLFEVFQVLTRDYGVRREEAWQETDRLSRSPLFWAGIHLRDAARILEIAAQDRVALTDAALIHLALEKGGQLVTQDAGLARAAQKRGAAVQDPVPEELVREIFVWEMANLLDKGLPRVLRAIHRWIGEHDPALAQRFLEATDHLRRLPT